ncbi:MULTISPECIES: GTPase domain-containing protein [unclassified Corallococcus]|uniref:GTPase domain-containing protein n=1 Tax=unclassified Corallococcus TaxID=2685029 RepID=UPI001A8C56F0|nr:MULTISPECIES: GTPase [unclassified Corallococcus]MBN9685568.1 50S ribosome-binding GTPase [Corallococcus sp. NCSPR001]WAS82984.1 50S ribosome-binding GTPase [Corallococcus sp. NCRR]
MSQPAVRPSARRERLGRVDLKSSVARCRHVARESFAATQAEFGRMEKALRAFDAELEKVARMELGRHSHAQLRKAVAPLLEQKRARIQERFKDLVDAHELRREQLDTFTVLFFGKTMAGKSTTIEAISAGSGDTIGDGGPDYTKKIEGVPCDGLLLVDTPGLLGFRKELAGVAESYVTRADLICMVVADDSIEPELFERMREIRGQHKRLAVLLNVKAANRRLLAGDLDDAWDAREVSEYVELIRVQLQSAFPGDEVPIIPYCANVAFEAQREEDPDRRAFLWEHSRIDDVIRVVANTLTRDGLAIRATAPFDALAWFAQSIADELEEDLPVLQRQLPELRRKRGEAARRFERVTVDSATELSQLKGHFLRVNDQLYDLAGEIIRGEKSESPKNAFRRVCRWKTVQEMAHGYQQGVIKRLQRNVEDFREGLRSDLVALMQIEAEIENVDEPEFESQDWKKGAARLLRRSKPFAGGGGAVLGGAIGGLLGPIGALVGSLLGGWLFSSGVETMAEELDASAARELNRQHRDLRQAMQDQLWTAYRSLNDRLYEWTKAATAKTGHSVGDFLGGLCDAFDGLVRATGTLVDTLHHSRHVLARASYRVLLTQCHPAFRSGKVELVDATQWMRYRAKLRVWCSDGGSPIGLVVGRGGAQLRAIQAHIGTPIDVVADTGERTTREMVVDALRPARLDPRAVSISQVISVQADGPLVGAIRGRRSRNLLLASEVLGVKISLVTKARAEQRGSR